MKKRVFAVLLAALCMLSGSLAVYANTTGQEAPIITDVYTDDFYIDSDTFTIMLNVENVKDLRNHLTLTVKEEGTNRIVAEQIGMFYEHQGLICAMKVVGTVEQDVPYPVEFSYTGSYDVQYPSYRVMVMPSSEPAIMGIELLGEQSNSFKLTLRNVNEEEGYALFYQDEYGEYTIKKTAVVEAGGVLEVTFGEDIFYSSYNSIYLCDYDAEYPYSYYDIVSLREFIQDGGAGNISNEGVNCDTHLGVDATEVWFNMYEKGFAYQSYTAEDVAKVNVYLFDMTDGKIVGTLGSKSFREEYATIEGAVNVTGTLDAAHQYIMVFNDGYSIRTSDQLVIVTEKKIADVYVTANPKGSFGNTLPVGTQTVYVSMNCYNFTYQEYIETQMQLLDQSGNLLGTGAYQTNDGLFVINLAQPLDAGAYKLNMTSPHASRTVNITVKNSGEVSVYRWQYMNEPIVYDGKTYFVISGGHLNYDPAEMTYQVEMLDGSVVPAAFNRVLYSNENETRYVVTADQVLTGIDFETPATLCLYQNGEEFILGDSNLSIQYLHLMDGPFLYEGYYETEDLFTFYGEGISSSVDYDIVAMDDILEAYQKVSNVSVIDGSLVVSKEDMAVIHTKCGLTSDGYGDEPKEFYFEADGEYFAQIYGERLGTLMVKDVFRFQKAATNRAYEVLNLPYLTYAQYRVAASEDALSTMPFQNIDTGILYSLDATREGEQTVYAQFKTADGTVSRVQTTSIVIDLTAPVLGIISDMEQEYVVGSDGILRIPMDYEAEEEGMIYFNLYDRNGDLIGYPAENMVELYMPSTMAFFWADEADYESAAKLGVVMTDKAGNKSTEQFFTITVRSESTPSIATPEIIDLSSRYGATANEVYVDIDFENMPTGSYLYIVGYDTNGRLVDTFLMEEGTVMQEAPMLSGAGITRVKAFAWDGLTAMRPVCQEMSCAVQ